MDRIRNRNRNRDLFEKLSIELIHIILSFLITQKKISNLGHINLSFLIITQKKISNSGRRFVDTKEAHQTIILSKQFLQAWSTFPDLYFSEFAFSKYLHRLPSNANHARQASTARKRYANYVLREITRYQQHNIPIRRLHIAAQVQDDYNSFDQSICRANQNGVQEVYLRMVKLRPCNLIRTIFALKQLVSLILLHCELVNTTGGECCDIFVNCVSLRMLKLERVKINEELFQKLMGSCPLMEEIKIDSCEGLENIQIANLPLLKRLKVYTSGKQRVDVKVESLELMTFGGTFLNIDSARNLKVLKLQWANIRDEHLLNLIAKCSVLEELTIRNCDKIENISVSSRSLSFLSLLGCWHLMEVEIDAPNLNTFEYAGERALSSLSFTSGGSEKRKSSVTLIWSDEGPEQVPSFLELSAFFMALKHSDNVSLEISSTEIIFDRSIIDGLRDENNIPEFDEVYITVSSPSSTYSALMEGLLWSFSPKIISVKRDSKYDEEFIKHLCEVLLVEHDDHPNISTSASESWRSYFKQAKFNDRDDEWRPLHSWKSLADALANLGDHYILKLSRD